MIKTLFSQIILFFKWSATCFLKKFILNYEWFKTILLLTFLSVLFFALFSFFYIFINSDYIDSSICFSSECLENFTKWFSTPIYILENGLALLSLFAAISGVYIALMNYVISVKSSALSGHIGHLNLFKSYVESEVEKRDELSLSSIDIFCWYRVMFPRSVEGDVSVSDEYKTYISNIVRCIEKTNKTLTQPTDPYCYKAHQGRMMDSTAKIGLSLNRLPKNNFFLVETQVLKIIDSVNSTFATGLTGIQPVDIKRKYT